MSPFPPSPRSAPLPAPAGSINEWINGHPIITPYIEIGMVIRLQRMGLVVVVIQEAGTTSYDCQVLVGNDRYPPNGHRIAVSWEELRRGEHVDLSSLLKAGVDVELLKEELALQTTWMRHDRELDYPVQALPWALALDVFARLRRPK